MAQQPDVYVGANPGGMPAIGRWLKTQLDSGDIPAARKEHIAEMVARGVHPVTVAELDAQNVLRVTVTVEPNEHLMSTLRAMGWEG